VVGFQFFGERAPESFGSFDISVVTLFGVVTTLQPWPLDLPLIIPNPDLNVHNSSGGIGSGIICSIGNRNCSNNSNFRRSEHKSHVLDYGVACFACSFAIICILMLVQVVPSLP
jgi:hypothetical protein